MLDISQLDNNIEFFLFSSSSSKTDIQPLNLRAFLRFPTIAASKNVPAYNNIVISGAPQYLECVIGEEDGSKDAADVHNVDDDDDEVSLSSEADVAIGIESDDDDVEEHEQMDLSLQEVDNINNDVEEEQEQADLSLHGYSDDNRLIIDESVDEMEMNEFDNNRNGNIGLNANNNPLFANVCILSKLRSIHQNKGNCEHYRNDPENVECKGRGQWMCDNKCQLDNSNNKFCFTNVHRCFHDFHKYVKKQNGHFPVRSIRGNCQKILTNGKKCSKKTTVRCSKCKNNYCFKGEDANECFYSCSHNE